MASQAVVPRANDSKVIGGMPPGHVCGANQPPTEGKAA